MVERHNTTISLVHYRATTPINSSPSKRARMVKGDGPRDDVGLPVAVTADDQKQATEDTDIG